MISCVYCFIKTFFSRNVRPKREYSSVRTRRVSIYVRSESNTPKYTVVVTCTRYVGRHNARCSRFVLRCARVIFHPRVWRIKVMRLNKFVDERVYKWRKVSIRFGGTDVPNTLLTWNRTRSFACTAAVLVSHSYAGIDVITVVCITEDVTIASPAVSFPRSYWFERTSTYDVSSRLQRWFHYGSVVQNQRNIYVMCVCVCLMFLNLEPVFCFCRITRNGLTITD